VTPRARTAALLVATGLLTAACSSGAHRASYGPVPAASAAPTSGDLSAPTSPTGPEAAATAAAQTEADRLIGLVGPPAGSTTLTQAPNGLTGPAEQPAMSNLVFAARLWSMPLSLDAAQQWALKQKPGGMDARGPGFGSTSVHGTVVMLDRIYYAPTDPRWSVDELQLSIAPHDANSSYLRADALVAPLDQHPLQDTTSGPRVRVAAAGPCPSDVAGAVGVSNPGQSDLDSALVPAGDPSAALVCRYYGNGHGNGLIHTWQLGPAQAAKLAAAARALSLAHDDNVTRHCPAGFGAVSVIAFAYPGRPDVDLWNTDDGCTFVGNGHVRNDFGGLPDEPSSATPST
jgi:hypothetical protein